MPYRKWSEEALRRAEFQLMECAPGTWHEKISAALNEAIAQAEREDRAERRDRLLARIRDNRAGQT